MGWFTYFATILHPYREFFTLPPEKIASLNYGLFEFFCFAENSFTLYF
jgi:hypothetical protein